MKTIFILIVIGIAIATAVTDVESWANFKTKYGKSYGVEEHKRFSIFVSNLRRAEKLQKHSMTAKFGVTKFMDLTVEEFHEKYAHLNSTQRVNWINSLKRFRGISARDGVDWRGKAVTPVLDQGECGGCWAFSDAGAMEGCIMIKNGGTEVDVSVQQILDCCHAGGSDGCNGGFPQDCLKWACDNDLATAQSYPLENKNGKCKPVTDVAIPAGTCKYVKVDATESALQAAIMNAPVSVGVDANILMYYTGGVISGAECKGTSIDHAVLLVAWDGNPTDGVYTLKNSWGADWGEAGYFRIAAGDDCLGVDDMSAEAIPN